MPTKDHITIIPKIIAKKKSIPAPLILLLVLLLPPTCVGTVQYIVCEKEGIKECLLPEYMAKD